MEYSEKAHVESDCFSDALMTILYQVEQLCTYQ